MSVSLIHQRAGRRSRLAAERRAGPKPRTTRITEREMKLERQNRRLSRFDNRLGHALYWETNTDFRSAGLSFGVP